MADMAKSATCFIPIHVLFNWSEQPRYVINAHSPLRDISDGGGGNYEEAETFFFENR